MARNTPGSGAKYREGSYNANKTKQIQNGKWVDVNVPHRGQRATLNGKDVVADGNGNWKTAQNMDSAGNLSGSQKTVGSYRPGINRGDYSSGLESNKLVVDGVTYDMNYPEHKKLMNSRADKKIKGQHEKMRAGGPPEPDREPLSEDATVSTIRNPSNPPRNAAEFGAFMQTLTGDRYGIKFPGEQERNGYQSIYLPGTRSAGEDESAADNKVMGRSPQQAIDFVNGGTTEIVIGGNMGAQTGTSSAPDKGDQSRVVTGFNGHEFGGEHEAPPTIFRDKRSRALLDYDGDGGMMGAMRAAEAAQNTIKQNGVLYALDGEGKGTALDEDTAREFKKDGNKMASQDFLKNYRYVPSSPAETESADSRQPVMPSTATDTGKFTRGRESNVIEDPSETFRSLGLM